mgnify:CR=1 FL=1
MDIIYEKAVPADLDELCSVIKRAVEKMDSMGIFQWDEVYPDRATLQDDIEKGQIYVGRTGGRIAVMFVLNMQYDESYNHAAWKDPDVPYRVLHRFCVDPDFQGCGVGGKALDHIEKLLSEQDVHAVRIDVFSKNPYALKMYEKHGYTVAGTGDFRMGLFMLMEKYF